ncbi:MAG: hypothetical protein II467_04355 [Bacilli bacterium]|nr:hypothetical protein [Bacilli bacterium]
MPSNRRDYEIKAKGKRMFEVFFYHSSGKESHVSVFGKSRYEKDILHDPRYDSPTSFDLSIIDSLSSEYLRGSYGGYGYSYYGGYGYNPYTQAEAREFLLEAADRLSVEEEGSYYFSHYGREILYLYFKYPRLFPQLGLEIMDYAKFFFPESLSKDEESSLFREMKTSLPFGVSFFLLAAANGNVSYFLAMELFATRRTFIEAFREKVERLAANRENHELLIKLGTNFPFINSSKANAVLLEHNHGLGIDFNALFPFLLKQEAYKDMAYCLASSSIYADILANSVDSPYLYYLSALDSHGYKEEAKLIAKKICKSTENPLIYKYLSAYFDKEEKADLSSSADVAHFSYGKYNSGSFSFFQADIDPSDIESYASFSRLIPLYGADILETDNIGKEKATDIKKEIRPRIRSIRLDKIPSGEEEATILASIKLADAPSYKALFEEGGESPFPIWHLYKARWRKENAKKATEVKPYDLRPSSNEDQED